MLKSTTALLIAGNLLLPVVANAACVQADLAGAWQVYSYDADAEENDPGYDGDGEWLRCALTITAQGGMTGRCTNSKGDSGLLSNASATMTVPARCTFTARLTLLGHVERISHATLSLDKLTAQGVGVGVTPPDGDFIVSFVKI